MISRKATLRFLMLIFSLPGANSSFPEHKIGVFVRFWLSRPSFSGFSSTKSRFLCFFGLRNPCFRAFRAQNRHFCARAEGQVASGSVKVTFVQFTARANVPQRCLEQGFARAVICRNAAPSQATAISSIQHLHPGQATSLIQHQTPASLARRQPHSAQMRQIASQTGVLFSAG